MGLLPWWFIYLSTNSNNSGHLFKFWLHSSLETCSVFLDTSKAFDRVWHYYEFYLNQNKVMLIQIYFNKWQAFWVVDFKGYTQ